MKHECDDGGGGDNDDDDVDNDMKLAVLI